MYAGVLVCEMNVICSKRCVLLVFKVQFFNRGFALLQVVFFKDVFLKILGYFASIACLL